MQVHSLLIINYFGHQNSTTAPTSVLTSNLQVGNNHQSKYMVKIKQYAGLVFVCIMNNDLCIIYLKLYEYSLILLFLMLELCNVILIKVWNFLIFNLFNYHFISQLRNREFMTSVTIFYLVKTLQLTDQFVTVRASKNISWTSSTPPWTFMLFILFHWLFCILIPSTPILLKSSYKFSYLYLRLIGISIYLSLNELFLPSQCNNYLNK